jgi:hypothetical protein
MITTGQTISNLAIANNESVVQQSIIGFFQSKSNLLFNRFRGDDGVLYDESSKNKKWYVSILFEFKLDENLSSNKSLAKALVQSLVYLHRMDESTQLKTPKVVAIVDKNEFVYFHTNQLISYLVEEIKWPSSASDCWKEVPSLYELVLNEDCASFESGNVHPVYATFALGRDAEWACRLFVLEMKEAYEEGIGTFLTIHHKSPALVGSNVLFNSLSFLNCWIIKS